MSDYPNESDRRPRRPNDAYPPPPTYPPLGDRADYGANNDRRPRPPRFDSNGAGSTGPPASELPPPPMGQALNQNQNQGQRPSALKREGSRNRVPHLRPEFPDESSYLGSQSPDLERKNRRRDKEFRDKRDGYESDEGEMLRKGKPRGDRPPPGADDFNGPDPRRRRPRDDRDPRDGPPRDRDRRDRQPQDRDRYDDARPPPRRRDDYDDRDAPPRRRRDQHDDYNDPPPRRRGDKPIEYGSEPIPIPRRRNSERGRADRYRKDDYSDSEDDDDPPRRHRSQEDRRRRRDAYDDDRNYQTDPRDQRRRRQEIYDRDRDDRRRDKSRRRYEDDYSDEDDYDRRDRRDSRRDRRKPPKEIKVGKYDIGPYVETGKKHYSTLAPIVTPLVVNMARKYLSGR